MTDNNEWGYSTSKGINFEPIPEGDHDAVVHGVVVLGRQSVPVFVNGRPSDSQTEIKQQLKVIFELPNSRRNDENGFTNVIHKVVNVTDNVEKGNFAKLLRTLGLSANTEKEVRSYWNKEGCEKLLGRPVSITIINDESSSGKVYSKIAKEGLAKFDPRLPRPKGERELFYFNPKMPDLKVFNDVLTFWTKKEVMNSVDSDQFPKELHEAWAKAQEDQVQKEANRGSNKADKSSKVDTSVLE